MHSKSQIYTCFMSTDNIYIYVGRGDLVIIALWSLSLYGTLNHLLNITAETAYSMTKCIKKGDSITYYFFLYKNS